MASTPNLTASTVAVVAANTVPTPADANTTTFRRRFEAAAAWLEASQKGKELGKKGCWERGWSRKVRSHTWG
jgi:hypothetical protein